MYTRLIYIWNLMTESGDYCHHQIKHHVRIVSGTSDTWLERSSWVDYVWTNSYVCNWIIGYSMTVWLNQHYWLKIQYNIYVSQYIFKLKNGGQTEFFKSNVCTTLILSKWVYSFETWTISCNFINVTAYRTALLT